MKNILNTLATLFLFVGIVMMAGSANDCDGDCMETANTISQMLMYAGIGLTFFIAGAVILLKGNNEKA